MKQDIILVSPRTEHLTNICKILKHFGMDVSQVENIGSVNAGLISHSPAFLLLDENVEEVESFLAKVHKLVLHPSPYIMVAGTFIHREDRIAILNVGADTCVGKPINAEEILAVVRAVQRRESRFARMQRGRLLPRIEHKELTIDPLRRIVTMRGKQVSLTIKEFDILCFLAYRAGTVVTKEELFESVWKEPYHQASTGVIDHISSLRQKLGLHKKNKDYIETVFGIGYRFADIKDENYSCDV